MQNFAQRCLAKTVIAAVNVYLYVRFWRLVRLFVQRVGYWPNLANPSSYNEKTNWRKIFDRNPDFPILQDKLAAREFVKSRCPDVKLLDVLWSGDDANSIPFDDIDRPVVIKTNHGCGYNYFVPDPERLDRLDAILYFDRIMAQRWGDQFYEWAYQTIRPRIFVEEMLIDSIGAVAATSKVSVYDGVTRLFQIVKVTASGEERTYFDQHGQTVDARPDKQLNPSTIEWSPIIQETGKHAAALCRDFEALRADFLIHEGEAFFNEFTIYPGSGLTAYFPRNFDYRRGEHWDISKSHYFASQDSMMRRVYRRCLETLRPAA